MATGIYTQATSKYRIQLGLETPLGEALVEDTSYSFEYMGEFFRQYFFFMEEGEIPFNCVELSWVKEPRALNKHHANVVTENDQSMSLSYIYSIGAPKGSPQTDTVGV